LGKGVLGRADLLDREGERRSLEALQDLERVLGRMLRIGIRPGRRREASHRPGHHDLDPELATVGVDRIDDPGQRFDLLFGIDADPVHREGRLRRLKRSGQDEAQPALGPLLEPAHRLLVAAAVLSVRHVEHRGEPEPILQSHAVDLDRLEDLQTGHLRPPGCVWGCAPF
jgi:hypothetical protein